MKSRRDCIIAIIASVLAVVIVCLTCIYASIPRLPPWEKEKIELERTGPGPIWYDENGYVEEPGVYRYIGTYGYCYAFLVIGDGQGATFDPMSGPFELRGLSRPVYYPIDATVLLYHTKRTFTYGIGTPWEITVRARYLDIMGSEQRKEWLSDAQLERLTRDVEKLAKAHE